MSLLIRIILITLVCLSLGCTSTPKTFVKTQYIEVPTPVRYKLVKPDRPKYLSTDTTHSYILKLITYTKSLEIIIEENNKEHSE